jgi:hypothetical protein
MLEPNLGTPFLDFGKDARPIRHPEARKTPFAADGLHGPCQLVHRAGEAGSASYVPRRLPLSVGARIGLVAMGGIALLFVVAWWVSL